jgi:selenide,water dikinase
LQAENLRLRRALDRVDAAAAHPAFPLLFDPQTAGGLLAGVPADTVRACVDALRDRGYGRATVIGEIRHASEGAAAVRLLARDMNESARWA